VIRSIVEAHGGNINIYSKNLLGGGKHGMVMQLTLPASGRTPHEAAIHEFLLIKHGLGDAAGVLEALKNLKIIPHIAQKPKDADLSPRHASLGLTVLADAKIAAELKERVSGGDAAGITVLPVEIGEGGTAFIGAGGGRELFTEEFVAGYLMEPIKES
jgi:hypothetical protein